MRFILPILLLAISLGVSRAEHRIALVVGNDGPPEATTGLAHYGFRCEILEPVSQKELRRRIDDWAARTPTNSSALLYFAGEAKREKVDGRSAFSLLAVDDRPVPVIDVLETMSQTGGSRLNLLVVQASGQNELAENLPPNCLVALGEQPLLGGNGDLLASLQPITIASSLPPTASVSGSGSTAISPPDRFTPGRQAGDEWVNARGMVFCWCPPGSYLAGSPEDTPGRFPDEQQRRVVIKDGFWIGKYELTASQNLRNRSHRSVATHKNHPVNMLHWDDGRSMLKRFTEEERNAGRLPTGWEYGLPTEDQWEYAARAGTATRYYFGDDMSSLPEHANFADKSYYDSGDVFSNAAHRTLDDGFVTLAPAGSFSPNPWGLHDVYGNVTEWCRDHGARGGAWVSVPENCRSAYRDYYSSRNEQIYLGYRLVIQPNAPDAETPGK